MPPHTTHTLAGTRGDLRIAVVDAHGRGERADGQRVESRRYRARMAALGMRAPETLRARIRRELRAARESAAR